MNVVLCGLPMSGKTTIGKMVAKEVNWNFIDTDNLIENEYAARTNHQCTCRQIFIDHGEAAFRQLEEQQIATLEKSMQCVIALGGGSLCHQRNAHILKSIGPVIYLKASAFNIWKRIDQRGIPAYLDQNNPEKWFYEVAKKRISLYEQTADVIIETDDLTEHAVVAQVLTFIRTSYGK